jgi:hypothetical protein
VLPATGTDTSRAPPSIGSRRQQRRLPSAAMRIFPRTTRGSSCQIWACSQRLSMNMNVCATDDFVKSVVAVIYYMEQANREGDCTPTMFFDRNIMDRPMMCIFSILSNSTTISWGLPHLSVLAPPRWTVVRHPRSVASARLPLGMTSSLARPSSQIRLAEAQGWL